MIKKLTNKGFTLTELMVVVFILGILASIAIPNYLTNVETARAREAIDFARQWQNARDIYFAENGHMPTATGLDVIDLDIASPFMEGAYQTRFFYIQPVDTNTIVFKRDGVRYLIYATDNDLRCCWLNGEDKCRKLCQNLVSNVNENTTASSFSFQQEGYTCYTFAETD